MNIGFFGFNNAVCCGFLVLLLSGSFLLCSVSIHLPGTCIVLYM